MSRIDCTPEEKIHELLLYLRKDKKGIYEDAKRVLKFLYKTINEDYFDKLLTLEQKKENERESYVKKITSSKSELYNNYINGEDAILDNFIKLCHNNPEYFNVFSKK